MIAKYNEKYYMCNKLTDTVNIITDKKNKYDDSFTIVGYGPYWSKKVSLNDPKLTDVYKIDLYVKYDTGIPTVPVVWKLGVNPDVLKDNMIKLVFYNGILPGWKGEDKTIGYKYINIDEIKGGSIKYTFYKKNNELCTPLFIHQKETSILEIINIEKNILNI